MKTLNCVLLIFLASSSLLSQETADSVHFRLGILVDFNGSLIDQLGLKYRTSDDLSLFFRVRLNFFKNTYSEHSQDPYNGNDIKLTVGGEHVVADIYDMSLLALASVTYATSRFEQGYTAAQGGINYQLQKSTSYLIGPGVGVEYHIFDQLSLSLFNSFQIAYTKESYEYLTSTTSSKRTQFRIAEAFMTFTFYF